jgi:predicted AAA+ superfamily ATPase
MKRRILFDYFRQKRQSRLGRIIVLTGARQTGKTTIAGHCFPDYAYLSIEDPVKRKDYQRLTAAQWEALYPRAVLDEVQKEPSLIESAVIAEIYKQIKTYRLPFTCYHFRTPDGREVDLLLEAADYFIAVEVKTTEHVDQRHQRHLRGLGELLNKPLKQSFVLSNDTGTQYFGPDIIAMHAAAFLC